MNTIYSELTKKYPTSEALFAFLRSEEGGRLTVRDTSDPAYAMIYYDKEKSNMTGAIAQWFRSVIWNKVTNHPVCVSPPRGRKFMEAADAGVKEFKVEEFVDGVMINMFYDGQHWRLATRTQLDANNHFYGTRPYAALFHEALVAQSVQLDPSLCYSWVLQHPEERIVVPCAYGIPRLYNVGAWHIGADATVSDGELIALCAPLVHDIKTLEDVKERVATFGKRHGYKWQGFVLKAGGNRYKIRSGEYDAARELRGNQANRRFLWLEHWKEGHLAAYLKVFPEETHDAEAVVNAFKQATQELHNYYQQVYRARTLPLGQAPRKYRKFLWDVHQAGKGAYFAHLRDFMNAQDTARQLWLVTFDARFGAPDA
jgi:hypothetical protein